MSKKDFMKIDILDCPDGHYGLMSSDIDLVCPHCGKEFKSVYHVLVQKKKVFIFR